MLKKYKNYIILFYLSVVGCMAVAIFYDLQIDIKLNDPTNPFAVWFYNTGEIPGRLICPIAGAVLYYLSQSKFGKPVGFCITMGGSAYLGYYIGHHFFKDENNLIFGIVYGIGCGVIILLAGRYITVPDSMKKPLVVLAVAGIVVMFLQLGAIEGLKYLWGRVRFRDLLVDGSYDRFTPWYHPNGINGNKSFPSGHTAGAGMSYLAMLLPLCSKKAREHTAACFVIPFLYTSIVAYTRLVMGAHYLSDVTVGGAISFTLVIITLTILEKSKQASPHNNFNS